MENNWIDQSVIINPKDNKFKPSLTNEEQEELNYLVQRILACGYNKLTQEQKQRRAFLLDKKYPGEFTDEL